MCRLLITSVLFLAQAECSEALQSDGSTMSFLHFLCVIQRKKNPLNADSISANAALFNDGDYLLGNHLYELLYLFFEANGKFVFKQSKV